MLNDLFKDKLRVLAEDEFMLQALTALVKENIEKINPEIEKTNDDRILGQKFRAAKEAERLLKGVLEDISSYKIQRSGNNQINKGK